MEVMHKGKPFPTCIVCRSYGNVIDSFVPASYSLDIGLESMLHMYKDYAVRQAPRDLNEQRAM